MRYARACLLGDLCAEGSCILDWLNVRPLLLPAGKEWLFSLMMSLVWPSQAAAVPRMPAARLRL
jgi:hypothetical protein